MVSRKAHRRGARSKEDTVRRHARERGRERYGVEMGADLERFIIGRITSGRSTPVERQSLRVSVHDVTLDDGQHVRVVYDKERRQIVTFLPMPERDHAAEATSPEQRSRP